MTFANINYHVAPEDGARPWLKDLDTFVLSQTVSNLFQQLRAGDAGMGMAGDTLR